MVEPKPEESIEEAKVLYEDEEEEVDEETDEEEDEEEDDEDEEANEDPGAREEEGRRVELSLRGSTRRSRS